MTHEKMQDLEQKHSQLERQVITVAETQKLHFAKIDDVLTHMKDQSSKMADVSSQLAVVISQMSDRHEFERRMGGRMDKYETLSHDTYALAKSHEKPIARQEDIYRKIISASLMMIVAAMGVIWNLTSK